MTVVTDYTALLTRDQESNPRWNYPLALGAPVIVTYSFSEGAELPPPEELRHGATGAYAFTEYQREAFREIAAFVEARTGIRFIESSSEAMINLAMIHGSTVRGYAYYPPYDPNGRDSSLLLADESSGGGWGIQTHEFGHTLGLKHPHEGEITLDPTFFNSTHTVMGYASNYRITTLGSFDIEALQVLYGTTSDAMAGWDVSFDDDARTLTVTGAGADDGLLGVKGKNILDGAGGNDTLMGRNDGDVLIGGAGDDSVLGLNGHDTFIGGAGNDTFEGGAGEDRLVMGGARSDFLFGFEGSGSEIIRVYSDLRDGSRNVVSSVDLFEFSDMELSEDQIWNFTDIGFNFVESFTTPDLTLGQTASALFYLKNFSGTGAAENILVEAFLSADDVLDAGDRRVGETTMERLEARHSLSGHIDLSVPADMATGSYRLIYRADPANTLREWDETNNIVVAPDEVLVQAPMPNLSVFPTFGGTIFVSQGFSEFLGFYVQNFGGTKDATAVEVQAYLSLDDAFDPGDVLAGSTVISTVSAGNRVYSSMEITPPGTLPLGDYRLIYKADPLNSIAELDETDNVATASAVVSVIAPRPDLSVAGWSYSDLTTGVPQSLRVNLRNGGIADATDVRVRAYLSSDETLDGGDVAIGDGVISDLDAGGTGNATFAVTVPETVVPGDYRLLFKADPDDAIPELYETNNVAGSRTITVIQAEPDLSLYSVPDLAELLTGKATLLSIEVDNDGSKLAPASTLRIYLSSDAVLDASDTVIGQSTLEAIAPGGYLTTEVSLTAPVSIADGEWNLIVATDDGNAIPESDETNNVAVGYNPVWVRAPLPDLTVSGDGSSPLTPGWEHGTTVTVANRGTEKAAGFRVSAYLSADFSFGPDDILIASALTAGLGIGAERVIDLSMTAPRGTSQGYYRLLYVVDPEDLIAEEEAYTNTRYAGLSYVSAPVNRPVEGTLSAVRTGDDGSVLQADLSGLSDPDGMSAVRFAWMREGTIIPGETGRSLSLAASDQAKAFAVRVSYTDGASFEETVTSVPVRMDGFFGQRVAGTSSSEALTGGFGPDAIRGLAGNDTLAGEVGADTLAGGKGHDLLRGASGNDSLSGNAGRDTAFGGGGQDSLFGGGGNDLLRGDKGNDVLNGETGHDFLFGQAGRDSLSGGAGNDSLDGGIGNDTLRGEAGRDMLRGGTGHDTVLGAAGDDTLLGDAGNDKLTGEGGADLLKGGDGVDTLDGNGGNDTLNGAAGNDVLRGGDGRDLLIGGPGQDRLVGGTGPDRLNGGAGNDRIIGAGGRDTATGGGGADTFQFGKGDGQDVITDLGNADILLLDAALFGKGITPLKVVNRIGEATDDGYLLSFATGDSLLLAGADKAEVRTQIEFG